MSKASNYLSVGYQTNSDGEQYNLRDYRHASRLYADDYQVRAPKYGFLYYVSFQLSPKAPGGKIDKHIGVYVKKIDLPKFTVQTEMLNQYNRKTQVHTKLTYNPITIEFHDDNANVTNDLWYSYYNSLVIDGTYEGVNNSNPREFGDTKYSNTDYEYGIYDRGADSFIERIDIYMLHHTLQDHTLISLVNPKITEWRHDTASQSDSTKMMQNSMTVIYESVLLYRGKDNRKITGFVNELYDPGKSPVRVSPWDAGYNKNTDSRPGNATIFNQIEGSAFYRPGNRVQDNGGRRSSRQVNDQMFDVRRNQQYGVINPPNTVNNPLLDVAGVLAKNYLQKNGLGRVGPVGYTIASSALRAATSSGAGKYYDPPSTQAVPGLFQLPGGVGINIFKGLNTSVDGKLRINPAAVVFPPKR
jgi:hypothetical protein